MLPAGSRFRARIPEPMVHPRAWFLPVSLLASLPGAAQELPAPAPPGGGNYSLSATPEGAAFLGWVEPEGDGHALRFSELQRRGAGEGAAADTWGPAREIATGEGWFVNWADHPSVAALGEDRLAAHWLVRNPGAAGHYGYGLRIAYSTDRGASWREIFETGLENTASYSGFVSFAAEPGGFSAAYLAAPPGSEDSADMTLRVARFHEQGYLLGDHGLDPEVCSCCPTAMATVANEPLVVFRDRVRNPPEDDLRDISVARKIRGRWAPSEPVHADGWGINGCPVNGPAISARDGGIAVVWFTMATGEPEVRLAFSFDGGASFETPVRLDDGDAVGYSAVALLDDGSAAAGWLATGESRGEVRVRRVWPDGRIGPAIVVAEAPPGRGAGMLQLVRVADEPPEEPESEDDPGEDPEEGGEAEEAEDPFFDVGERLLIAWADGRVRTALLEPATLDIR